MVLIDGETLANLMIDHGVGVSLQRSYEVKRVDSDYFSEAPIVITINRGLRGRGLRGRENADTFFPGP